MAKKTITRERFLELAAQDDYSKADVAEMLSAGDVVRCAACGELSAYAWELCNAYGATNGEHNYNPEKGLIAHIGTASCWEFECGHCRAHNVERDAPILADCYTHAAD